MAETSERVQEALAAYLDYLELGGPKPDTSHLSASERGELQELVDALKLTEGVAFGLGRDVQPRLGRAVRAVTVDRERGEALVSQLKAALPPDVRIESDASVPFADVGGNAIAGKWIVGTFGGRVQVWLVAVESAHDLKSSECLTDLNRVFGALPEIAAVALIGRNLTCLLVQPEDCAAQIHIPSGSLVGRRYGQPIQPVAEAVAAFFNKLIPYWDPIPTFDAAATSSIDISAASKQLATAAVERQRDTGQRARRGNPKKKALLALGQKDITAITKLASGLFDGSVRPEDAEARIERLAKER